MDDILKEIAKEQSKNKLYRANDMEKSITPVVSSDDCSVFKLSNETGEGYITLYQVFKGVYFGYNDFHMTYYHSDIKPQKEVLCIDHCREGRLEYASIKNTYSYASIGDIKIDRRLSHSKRFDFPLSHYHGAMISFEFPEAEKSINEALKDCYIDLQSIQKKFCSHNFPYVIHKDPVVEHIFAELYTVPDKIRISYYKIKIIELLLYLDVLKLPNKVEQRPYFYKTQIEKIKALKSFLIEHMEENYTQEALSKQFDISMTQMKYCFKEVYGEPIAKWLTTYRMNQAAILMKEKRQYSITEIAGKVGYESSSKFAITFKKVMGKSPSEYRQAYWKVYE